MYEIMKPYQYLFGPTVNNNTFCEQGESAAILHLQRCLQAHTI